MKNKNGCNGDCANCAKCLADKNVTTLSYMEENHDGFLKKVFKPKKDTTAAGAAGSQLSAGADGSSSGSYTDDPTPRRDMSQTIQKGQTAVNAIQGFLAGVQSGMGQNQPPSGDYALPPSSGSDNTKVYWVIGIILVVIVIAVLGWYFWKKGKGKNKS